MKKVYILNSNINTKMDYQEAKDYLQEYLHFTLDSTLNLRTMAKQDELIKILLETYFIQDETEENDDVWEDDTKEREQEYRELQGF